MFVTIDGPNGVGKTSVCQELARLRPERRVLSLRQPSDSPMGQFARQREMQLGGLALAAVVVADRYFQIENEIIPALKAGYTVVCDRYAASTLVLQRMDGLDPELLWDMNAQVLVPDITVILQADPIVLTARLAKRVDLSRFEKKPNASDIESTYYQDAGNLLRTKGFHVLFIDTRAKPLITVAEEIWDEIDRLEQ